MTIKSRIFIGSSSEAIEIARAIHDVLKSDLECTVWETSFQLSLTTIESLFASLQTNDFAVFVFAPDDIAERRGNRVLIPRDNVTYELGLFSGKLGRERCFFVLPDNECIQLPSDLAAVGHGTYEIGRLDGNMREAVSSFCSLVRTHTKLLGRASPLLPSNIIELAVRFECAEWIKDDKERVQKKQELVIKMTEELRRAPINKLALIKKFTPGFIMLFAAAVQSNPSLDDDKISLLLPPTAIPRGVAQRTVVDSIKILNTSGKINHKLRSKLSDWLGQFQNVDVTLQHDLSELRKILQ